MLLLRFVALVILVVWIGGLTVLGGLAAPTIFATLTAHDPAGGRSLAGQVFGSVFARFQLVASWLGVLLIGVLGTQAILGPRPRLFGLRMWLGIAMLAMTLVSSLVLVPRIGAIRDAAGSIDGLAATDARRIEFERLHAVANGLSVLTIASGLWLVWLETKEH